MFSKSARLWQQMSALKGSIPCPRSIFSLDHIFNAIDQDRLKIIGPDRACAEWLMRNGAFVRWVGESDFVDSYNNLPLDLSDEGVYTIEEVKAEDASITHQGFPHFNGCHYIQTIAFRKCYGLNGKCIDYIAKYLRHSLKNLEIFNCGNLTSKGAMKLKQLTHLKSLKIGKLWTIDQFDKVAEELKQSMPQCDIQIIQETDETSP